MPDLTRYEMRFWAGVDGSWHWRAKFSEDQPYLGDVNGGFPTKGAAKFAALRAIEAHAEGEEHVDGEKLRRELRRGKTAIAGA